jgi:hypothetical protein
LSSVLVVPFAIVLLMAVALIVFGALSANDSEEVGLEAAKAGFQLLVLAIAGVGVTGALDWFSHQQDVRRRVNDAGFELLRDLINNYNKLKGARRTLRALGVPPAATAMSPRQGETLEREMRTLLEVQLAFERIGREIGIRLEDGDTRPSTRPQELLAGMESYVKNIVHEWEGNGATVASGKDVPAASITAWPCLRAFLKRSRDDPGKQFRTQVSEPLRDIEERFRVIVPTLRLGDEPPIDSAEQTDGASGGR